MANVRTTEGIVRKLGKPAAVQFLHDYVQERVHSGMTVSQIDHLLWSTRCRTPGCENQRDAAVKAFNSMY